MACVSSPIQQIDDLSIESLPTGKPVAAEKVVRIDGLILIVGKNGRLYAHGHRFDGRFSYTFGTWPWTDPLMKALAKAGVISKEAAKQHAEKAAEFTAKREAKNAADRLVYVAKEAGIKLTARQLAQIETMKGAE